MAAANVEPAPGAVTWQPVNGRAYAPEEIHRLKADLHLAYKDVVKRPSRDGLKSPHHEAPVVGYIWNCGPCCLPFLWQPFRKTSSRGLARAQEIRDLTINDRNLSMQTRWCTDAAAVEIQVTSMSGETRSLRIGPDALAGEVKVRLASMTGIPEPEVVLVCLGQRLSDDEPFPKEAIDGPAPHAVMLRVRRRRVLSGSHDGTLFLWDIDSGECLHNMRGHGDAIVSMSVDWKSRRALTGAHDCRLKLWDLDHGICVGTVTSPGHPAFCLAVDWSAGKALSGSWDHAMKVWDLNDFECRATLAGERNHSVAACLAMDWQSSRAINGSYDGDLSMWDLKSKSQVWSVEAHGGKVTSLQVLWDAERMISGGEDGAVRLWALRTPAPGAEGRPPEPSALWTLNQHRLQVCGLAMNLEARKAVSASWDGSAKVWHLRNERGGDAPPSAAARVIEQQPAVAVTCMDVDWHSSYAVGGIGKVLAVWDLEAPVEGGEVVHRLYGHEDAISCVALESSRPF